MEKMGEMTDGWASQLCDIKDGCVGMNADRCLTLMGRHEMEREERCKKATIYKFLKAARASG